MSSRRKDSFSRKKKPSTGGSYASGGLRANHASAGSAAAVGGAKPTHVAYFPKNIEAAKEKMAAGHKARSRAPSIAVEQYPGDPFSAVRLRSESSEPAMVQANIVLGVLTELLRDRGIDARQHAINPTDYFGMLMVMLEQHQARDTASETVGAVMFLLSLLLPQLPKSVLKLKSEPVAMVLIGVLEQHASDALITKHVLECCSTVLATLIDGALPPHAGKMLQVLLVYSLDHRPRIRRAGKEGVVENVKAMYELSVGNANSTQTGLPKAVNDTIVQFCLREIAQSTPKECQAVLFLCGLLQGSIQYLSISAAGKVLEALLSMVGKGRSILVKQAMATIDAFFIHASEVHLAGIDADEEATFDAHSHEAKQREKFLKMSQQLLLVLLTLKPHANDQDATTAYLHTLKNGLIHFTSALESIGSNGASMVSVDVLRRAHETLPELLTHIGEGLLSSNLEVVKNSSRAMEELIKKCVTTKFIQASLQEAQARAGSVKGGNGLAPPLYRVIEQIENLLGYRWKVEWNRILQLVACLFTACSSSVPAQTLLIPLLKKLDALHNESQQEVFSEDPSKDYRPALDEALGAACESLGPEALLTVLPLNLPTDFYRQASKKNATQKPLAEQLESSRAWLLPLFRNHNGPSSSCQFFLDFFLPIGLELHELEKTAIGQGRLVESKVFQGLKIAIWDILPSLLSSLPQDLESSFKPFVKRMVENFLNSDEYQYTHERIAKGLAGVVRKLKDRAGITVEGQVVNKTKQNQNDKDENDEAGDDDEADVDAVFSDSDDGDDADSDEDDAAAVARARVKRAVKAAQKKNAAVSAHAAPETSSEGNGKAAKGLKRLQHYTAAQATTLLQGTIAPIAKHLLPVLFNLAAMPATNKPAVFEAIMQYASIADKELLNQTFKTVLRKLLEHSMAAQARRVAAAKEKAALEAAMDDESPVVAPKHSPVAHQDAQRLHLLTDIVYALAAQSASSLNAENIAYLYQILHNQLVPVEGEEIVDPDGPLQKKLYKIFGTLIGLDGFFLSKWKECIKDLLDSSITLQPAALKARLTCLRLVLIHLPNLMFKDKYALSVLPSFIGELILASKEPAIKTRDLAFEILVETGRTMVRVQDDKLSESMGGSSQETIFGGFQHASSQQPMLQEYIYMIAGGLAGSSAHMQSASVLCLSRILYEFKSILNPDIITALLSTVLPFFESKSRELIKSLLAFVKVCILTFPLELLEIEAPKMVQGLVLWSTEKKQRFKLKIKLLFEILMKKLGSDTVKEMVPESQTALLDHIRKTKEREKRQKTEAYHAKKGQKANEDGGDGISHKPLQDYDSIMKDEADVDSDGRPSKSTTAGAPSKRLSAKDANAMWLRDDGDVDFLDPSVMTKVSSTNPAANKNERRVTGYGNGVTQDAATGKMRIAGAAASAEQSDQARAQAMIDIDELQGELNHAKKEKRKRQADDDEDDGDDGNGQVKRQQLPGSQFRSTKAGGDMKRKGQMQPYAFVALDPSAMNKRKKFTASRRLESIVSAARSGSQTGSAIAKHHSRSHANKSHKKHGHK